MFLSIICNTWNLIILFLDRVLICTCLFVMNFPEVGDQFIFCDSFFERRCSTFWHRCTIFSSQYECKLFSLAPIIELFCCFDFSCGIRIFVRDGQ